METDFSYIDENYKKIAYNVQEAFAKYRNSNEHIDICLLYTSDAADE